MNEDIGINEREKINEIEIFSNRLRYAGFSQEEIDLIVSKVYA